MAQELSDLLPDYTGGQVTPKTTAYDWLSGFAKSGIESIPEMIGITPSADTQTFRQDFPISGVLSEVAGMAVPYTGWLKATKAVAGFDKAVMALGNANKSPFLTGAVQEAARLAPFEIGRVAVSQVPGVGDHSLGDMVGSATMNLALGAGIGGLLHGMGSAGTREPSLKTLFPEIDVAAPLPLQARQMREVMTGMAPGETLDRAMGKLNETIRLARTEELPTSQKYVAALEDAHGDLDQQLNRLFRVKSDPDSRVLQTRKFAQGVEKDFPTQELWKGEAQVAGLPENFAEQGQFFRTLSFKQDAPAAPKIAQTIEGKLANNMTRVGDDLLMAREAGDGMFVMAKKYGGELGKAAPTDKWVLFKTDNPGVFAKDADRWAKIQVDKGKWVPQSELAADGGEIYNTGKGYMNMFPLRNYQAMATDKKGLSAMVDKMVPQSVRGPQNEIVARMGEAMKEYLAPRVYQFKNNFRANWIMNATKTMYDRAETLTNELMNGKVIVDKTRNLFFQNLKGQAGDVDMGFAPVRKLAEELSEADFKSFWENVWRKGTPAQDLKGLQESGTITPEVANFARNLDAIDKYNTGNINKAELAVGRTPSTWKEGHYGLSRNWEGDTRYALKNEAGELVGVAGGANRRAAKANAEALVKENPSWKVDYEYAVSGDSVPKEVKPGIHTPSFVLERQDIRGFKWDTKEFTKDEFLEAYENALRGRNNYQANMASTDMLGPHIDRLRMEDPAAFRMIEARMNDYAGVQSPFSRWQNKVVDEIAGPMLGTNSASKIVQYTNTALFNFQLGALKLAYPVVNALQFVQTVVPEAAFVMGRAPEASLAGKYSFFAAGGEKGPVGGVGVLSPLKLMSDSLKEMRSPSPGLTDAFQRAVNDRVIDPRLVEGYIGESATKVRDIAKVFRGESLNFTEWLRGVSEFLPAETERMSRTHAFTVGHGIARDFLKKGGESLNADEIYAFARQFTENTMYLYSAADKPRIFTTPAGSLMGLFKNWMFNYMSSMGEYTAQGFTHNNWSPLLWQTTGTFALGGLAATPLAWVADRFTKQWADKSSMQWAYDEFGAGGDAVMLGLPAALTGISLYSQVNSPVSNPVKDASSLFSLAAWDRVKATGKLVGGAMDHWQSTGEHPGYSQGVRELMARAFAPTTVYRTMGAIQPDQITSLGTGMPIAKNVPPVHRALYALGFNPVELDRAQAVSQELYTSQEKMKSQVTKLGKAWGDAQQNKDNAQMAQIMRQAVTWGVDVSAVISSGLTTLDKQTKDVIDRRIKPQDLGKYKSIMDLNR